MSETDSSKLLVKDADCKPFTRTEVLPSLKISKEAFSDSIKAYLGSRNVIHENKLSIFKFFLKTDSEIENIQSAAKEPPASESILTDAILHFSGLWNPAVQNHRIVCSFVILLMEFRDGKIYTTITQTKTF